MWEWDDWECDAGCMNLVSLVLMCCALAAVACALRDSIGSAVMQHRGRAAIGAASTILCTTSIGLGWDGESLVAVLMSCCLLSPAVYAISILWTEWAAERKRKRAVVMHLCSASRV